MKCTMCGIHIPKIKRKCYSCQGRGDFPPYRGNIVDWIIHRDETKNRVTCKRCHGTGTITEDGIKAHYEDNHKDLISIIKRYSYHECSCPVGGSAF